MLASIWLDSNPICPRNFCSIFEVGFRSRGAISSDLVAMSFHVLCFCVTTSLPWVLNQQFCDMWHVWWYKKRQLASKLPCYYDISYIQLNCIQVKHKQGPVHNCIKLETLQEHESEEKSRLRGTTNQNILFLQHFYYASVENQDFNINWKGLIK